MIRSDPERPFEAPWQAQVFAMTVALNRAGLFAWPEWAEVLGSELKRDGDDYYACWLRAFETLLARYDIAARPEIEALSAAWQRAAHATPHGKPIRLEKDPAA